MLPHLPHRVRDRVRVRLGVRVSVSYLLSAIMKSIEILGNTHDIHNGGHETTKASPNPSVSADGNPNPMG